MGFKEKIQRLSEKVIRLTEQAPKKNLSLLIKTEEAAKQAFVIEFISALEYDVHDPLEVEPEFGADFGVKKGEKVDYAVHRDGKPIILFECKKVDAPLYSIKDEKAEKVHEGQLFRYFSVADAKFAVLTNGIRYHVFTDLDVPRRMDDKPFLELNLLDIHEPTLEQFEKLSKSVFSPDAMYTAAREVRWTTEIKAKFAEQLKKPNDEFVKFFAHEHHVKKNFTATVLAQFSDITRRALNEFIEERIQGRLKTAQAIETYTPPSAPEPSSNGATTLGKKASEARRKPEEPQPQEVVVQQDDNHDGADGSEASPEELEGFEVVKSLLKGVDLNRVIARPNKSYFAVIWDNNRKPICRLYVRQGKKHLGLFDGKTRNKLNQMAETKVALDGGIADIKKHADKIGAAVGVYVAEAGPVKVLAK